MAKESVAERIIRLRKKAGFRFASNAIKALGVRPTTYYGWEQGAAIDTDTAARLARLFNVRPEAILFGTGDDEGRYHVVPVIGIISAGGSIETMSEQIDHSTPLFEIEVPFQLPPDALALEVRGDSMYPRYDNGDVIICRKTGDDVDIIVGREAAVATDAGNRYLKKVLRGTKSGLYDLESHNAPPMRDQRLVWVSPVNTVIRSGQWRAITAGNRSAST